MADLEISVGYLAAGANRQSAAADWGPDGAIAFGAGVNVALWRPTDQPPKGITSLLSGHTDVVKAVKFLPRGKHAESPSYIVSGGDDKCLRLWKLEKGQGTASCVQVVPEQHAAPINCIAVAQDASLLARRVIFASGGADASIKIWAFEKENVTLLQTIKTQPKFFPLALALSPLGGEYTEAFVLAAAGTKDFIQVFTGSAREEGSSDLEFKLQATLPGHEGWIRSLDFTHDPATPGDLLLASASQDKYIRLWRLHQGKELPAQAAQDDSNTAAAFLPGKSPSNKAHWINAAGLDYSVTFEALLFGHDDWIYSAKWHLSSPKTDGSKYQNLRLLSASADNSLAIWEADPTSGIWVTTARLGELSREKGATTATGSSGGFWTGLWSPNGDEVVTIGRTGAWRRWTHDPARDFWAPALAISGHVAPVTGISWARGGAYLLSASSDQTTRLHAQWTTSDEATTTKAHFPSTTTASPAAPQHPLAASNKMLGSMMFGPTAFSPEPTAQPSTPEDDSTWHEMARPQIHGYDLNCIAAVGDSQFVSGADEKLMRVFREPKAVAQLLSHLTNSTPEADRIAHLPDAADMPVLGLSNKAIDTSTDTPPADDSNPHAPPEPAPAPLPLTHPPLEDTLSRSTLFPETEKLYGHGYEISCLAASHSGRLVASACRASSLNHAVIRLFAAPPPESPSGAWTEIRPPLAAHTLTATRLRFSEDDAMLLSVGRDRQWAVFERKDGDGEGVYELLQARVKGHSRMILDCAWAPGEGRRVFATAGRDKCVKVWARGTGEESKGFELVTTVPGEHPVTAVDFLPQLSEAGNLVLAVGSEAGKVSVLSLSSADLSVVSIFTVPTELRLPKSVLQLAWRDPRGQRGVADRDDQHELAIAGEDNSLRIYAVRGV